MEDGSIEVMTKLKPQIKHFSPCPLCKIGTLKKFFCDVFRCTVCKRHIAPSKLNENEYFHANKYSRPWEWTKGTLK